MAISWTIGAWFFVALSCYSAWHGNLRWWHKFYQLALLNWIVYYLVVKGS